MIRTVLLPTDGSATAIAAGDLAADLAKCEGAKVVVLGVLHPHYWGDSTEFERDDVLLADIHGVVEAEVKRLASSGVNAVARNWDTPTDHVQDAIQQVAEEESADLVVMGTHGRSGLDRALLGSVTDRVLRHSTVPVLVVPMKAGTKAESSMKATAGAKA